jgi:N-methylhydantoinase B/oxoprolinase/acetone carboxylase alpha subunit
MENMARPNRTTEQEIADLEDSIAGLQEDLDLLAALVKRCGTDDCRAYFRVRIERKLARLAGLRQRRTEIRQRLRGE